jgi:hypothetical protein
MTNTKTSEIQYQEFILSSLVVFREAREKNLSESEINIMTQQLNEKYLTFLITLVLEDNHHDENIPVEIINQIKCGELNYNNVAEFTPSEPLYQFVTEAMKSALRQN